MYRLHEIFVYFYINLLKFFRIMSFVFDLKYLSQNSININMLGVFWNPQDEQFPKLSLILIRKQTRIKKSDQMIIGLLVIPLINGKRWSLIKYSTW